MLKPVLFVFPGNHQLGERLLLSGLFEKGEMLLRDFPDGETYIRTLSPVAGREVVVLCSLNNPNRRFLPLFFLCRHLRESGASSIKIIAPYLSYLRQDKVFKEGEALSSAYFADLFEGMADSIITIDPHLHRYGDLGEVYNVSTTAAGSAPRISKWIREHIPDAFLLGPDEESRQWIHEVAAEDHLPFGVLTKERTGDNTVKLTIPPEIILCGKNIVLVDDIISSGTTMLEACSMLKEHKLPVMACVAVHPLFSQYSYERICALGIPWVVSCNTIDHPSNAIDISPVLTGIVVQKKVFS